MTDLPSSRDLSFRVKPVPLDKSIVAPTIEDSSLILLYILKAGDTEIRISAMNASSLSVFYLHLEILYKQPCPTPTLADANLRYVYSGQFSIITPAFTEYLVSNPHLLSSHAGTFSKIGAKDKKLDLTFSTDMLAVLLSQVVVSADASVLLVNLCSGETYACLIPSFAHVSLLAREMSATRQHDGYVFVADRRPHYIYLNSAAGFPMDRLSTVATEQVSTPESSSKAEGNSLREVITDIVLAFLNTSVIFGVRVHYTYPINRQTNHQETPSNSSKASFQKRYSARMSTFVLDHRPRLLHIMPARLHLTSLYIKNLTAAVTMDLPSSPSVFRESKNGIIPFSSLCTDVYELLVRLQRITSRAKALCDLRKVFTSYFLALGSRIIYLNDACIDTVRDMFSCSVESPYIPFNMCSFKSTSLNARPSLYLALLHTSAGTIALLAVVTQVHDLFLLLNSSQVFDRILALSKDRGPHVSRSAQAGSKSSDTTFTYLGHTFSRPVLSSSFFLHSPCVLNSHLSCMQEQDASLANVPIMSRVFHGFSAASNISISSSLNDSLQKIESTIGSHIRQIQLFSTEKDLVNRYSNLERDIASILQEHTQISRCLSTIITCSQCVADPCHEALYHGRVSYETDHPITDSRNPAEFDTSDAWHDDTVISSPTDDAIMEAFSYMIPAPLYSVDFLFCELPDAWLDLYAFTLTSMTETSPRSNASPLRNEFFQLRCLSETTLSKTLGSFARGLLSALMGDDLKTLSLTTVERTFAVESSDGFLFLQFPKHIDAYCIATQSLVDKHMFPEAETGVFLDMQTYAQSHPRRHTSSSASQLEYFSRTQSVELRYDTVTQQAYLAHHLCYNNSDVLLSRQYTGCVLGGRMLSLGHGFYRGYLKRLCVCDSEDFSALVLGVCLQQDKFDRAYEISNLSLKHVFQRSLAYIRYMLRHGLFEGAESESLWVLTTVEELVVSLIIQRNDSETATMLLSFDDADSALLERELISTLALLHDPAVIGKRLNAFLLRRLSIFTTFVNLAAAYLSFATAKFGPAYGAAPTTLHIEARVDAILLCIELLLAVVAYTLCTEHSHSGVLDSEHHGSSTSYALVSVIERSTAMLPTIYSHLETLLSLVPEGCPQAGHTIERLLCQLNMLYRFPYAHSVHNKLLQQPALEFHKALLDLYASVEILFFRRRAFNIHSIRTTLDLLVSLMPDHNAALTDFRFLLRQAASDNRIASLEHLLPLAIRYDLTDTLCFLRNLCTAYTAELPYTSVLTAYLRFANAESTDSRGRWSTENAIRDLLMFAHASNKLITPAVVHHLVCLHAGLFLATDLQCGYDNERAVGFLKADSTVSCDLFRDVGFSGKHAACMRIEQDNERMQLLLLYTLSGVVPVHDIFFFGLAPSWLRSTALALLCKCFRYRRDELSAPNGRFDSLLLIHALAYSTGSSNLHNQKEALDAVQSYMQASPQSDSADALYPRLKESLLREAHNDGVTIAKATDLTQYLNGLEKTLRSERSKKAVDIVKTDSLPIVFSETQLRCAACRLSCFARVSDWILYPCTHAFHNECLRSRSEVGVCPLCTGEIETSVEPLQAYPYRFYID